MQQGERAPEVVGNRGEADLNPGLGEAEPVQPARAVRALTGAEDLLDPAADAAHGGIVRAREPVERLGPAASDAVRGPPPRPRITLSADPPAKAALSL